MLNPPIYKLLSSHTISNCDLKFKIHERHSVASQKNIYFLYSWTDKKVID